MDNLIKGLDLLRGFGYFTAEYENPRWGDGYFYFPFRKGQAGKTVDSRLQNLGFSYSRVGYLRYPVRVRTNKDFK